MTPTIYCNECDAQVDLTIIGTGDYECPNCHTYYDDEAGVWDKEEAADMYALYKGAKLAGLIEDKEIKEEFYHG